MKILFVPVDFSPACTNAVDYAIEMARQFSSRIILFHAYHFPVTNFEGGYIPPVVDIKVEAEEELKTYMRQQQAKNGDVRIDYQLEMGLAADIIEESAIKNKADLIIMGIAENPGAFKEHFVGSVASKVAKSSSKPTLIIPEGSKYTSIKKVAYACDLDKDLEKSTTLVKVKEFCDLFKAELEILNVMKPDEELSVEKAETDKIIEKRFETTRHHSFFIFEEKVDKGLLDFITNNNVDMMIMCPKNHNFFHDLFIEGNTEKMIFHSPIPILTIHE